MDKETLSNYGWIVICTLVLAVMIALATPFGEYIRDGIWSVTNGLNDTLNKNMEIAGLSSDGNGDDSGDGSVDNNFATTLKYGQKYIVTKHSDNEYVGASYVFNEDGSLTMTTTFGETITSPAGRFYCENSQLYQEDEGVVGQITENGNKIILGDEDDVLLVLESTITGLRFGQEYIVSVDNANDGEWVGYSYVFYEDGSAVAFMRIGDYMEDEEEVPAGYFEYSETQIIDGGEVFAEIKNDGKGLTLENGQMVLVLASTIPTPNTSIKFGERYVNLTEDVSVTFYPNGSIIMCEASTGDIEDGAPACYFTYTETSIVCDMWEIECEILENGKQVNWCDEFILTLESEIEYLIQFDEKYICVEDSINDTQDSIVGAYYTFHRDGSFTYGVLYDINGETTETTQAGVLIYTDTQIILEIRVNNKVSRAVLGTAVNKDKILMGEGQETYTLIRESAVQPSATFTDGTTLSWAELKSKYNVTDTAIGNSAFKDCRTLKSIIIPSTVTTIGDSAFQGCSSLKDVLMLGNIQSIGNSAFRDCTALEIMPLPIVNSIGSYAFYGCYNLKGIRLLGELTAIAPHTFDNCKALVDVDIPDTVTSIGEHAFTNCAFDQFYMPESLVTIDSYAFFQCKNLGSVYGIPATVTSIGAYAFANCTSLSTTFSYDGTTTQWNAISKGTNWHSGSALTTVRCSNNNVTL